MVAALIPMLFGIVGLVVAYFIFQKVKAYPEGEDKVKAISDQIHLGAMVFMRTEYRILFCCFPNKLFRLLEIGGICVDLTGWLKGSFIPPNGLGGPWFRQVTTIPPPPGGR